MPDADVRGVGLTDANELENGLLIKRRKGSKDNITEWSPRLSEAWNQAKQIRNQILEKRKQPHPLKKQDRNIFISAKTGDRTQTSSLKTALSRIGNAAQKKASDLGIEFVRFTFHDIKRRGCTDTEGDKMKASGHRSLSMMRIYDVGLDLVKPAGKDK